MINPIERFASYVAAKYIYPKTTGQLVSVNVNGQIMLLDDYIELNREVTHPIGTPVLCFSEVAPVKATLEKFGDIWMPPNGALVSRNEFPKYFDLVGYNCGWGATATSTGDLDKQGNALPVVGEPEFFRLPDTRAKFLRMEGQQTLENEWTDSEGVKHSVSTTYVANLYKTVLDAIRGISGNIASLNAFCFNSNIFSGALFPDSRYKGDPPLPHSEVAEEGCSVLIFDSSRVSPVANEIKPLSLTVSTLIKVS